MTKVRRESDSVGKEAALGNGIEPPGARPVDRQEPSPLASRLSPHLAEVIEADTVQFMAECRQLYAAPDFGSFIRVDGASKVEVTAGSSLTPDPRPLTPAAYGVVCYVATGAVDSGRRTQALHLPPDRLAERMPQLELVLRTCFRAQIVGHEAEREIRPFLPPRPPEIHRFVHPCDPDEIEALTLEPDFLRALATAPEAPVEDLLAAAIWQAAAVRGAGPAADAFLVECGKAVAALFRREPDRFQSVMRRLQASRRATAGAPWEQPIDLI